MYECNDNNNNNNNNNDILYLAETMKICRLKLRAVLARSGRDAR
jgi:hypothetical protein